MLTSTAAPHHPLGTHRASDPIAPCIWHGGTRGDMPQEPSMNIHILEDAIHELEAERSAIDTTITRLRGMTHKEVVVTQNESFVGLGIAEAAARYLRQTGEPKSTREIMEALRAGGLTPKRYQTVYGLLHRRKQTLRDVQNFEGKWKVLPTHEERHPQH